MLVVLSVFCWSSTAERRRHSFARASGGAVDSIRSGFVLNIYLLVMPQAYG